MDLLPDEMDVFRSPALPLIRLPRLLRMVKLQKFALLAESLPDKSIFWYPTAARKLRKIIKDKAIRVIHSRSTPLAGHFLGLYAKKISGLPWLAHFCDPWTDGPLYTVKWSFLARMHARWESSIISAADAITFTTNAACRIVMAKYPSEWMNKCHIIPHGFVTGSSIPKPRRLFDPRFLNIVYLGNFYGTRSPHGLFQALNKMHKKSKTHGELRIYLIGRMPHHRYATLARQYGIDHMICLKDAVPYQTAMAYAQEADVLLTINSIYKNPDFFLESKLFEYLGFGKPILGIVYLSGKTAAMLKNAGCYVADIQNPVHIAKTLKKIVETWKKGRLKIPDIDRPEISRFKMENTTGNLVAILEAMNGCHS
jgi:hypothetical protein